VKVITAVIYALMGIQILAFDGSQYILIFGAIFWVFYNFYQVIRSTEKDFKYKKNILLVIRRTAIVYIFGLIILLASGVISIKEGQSSFSGLELIFAVVLFGLFYFIFSVYTRDFYYVMKKSYGNSLFVSYSVSIILIAVTYVIKSRIGELPSFILTLDFISLFSFEICLKILKKYSLSNNIYKKFFITRLKTKQKPKDLTWKFHAGYALMMLAFCGFSFFAAYVAFIFAFAGLGMIYSASAEYILELNSQKTLVKKNNGQILKER
jgi:hypothetical protein